MNTRLVLVRALIVIASVGLAGGVGFGCNSSVSQASPPESLPQDQSPPAAEEPQTPAPTGSGQSAAPSGKQPDLLLAIPARDHAPERPEAGWCAETALQEALLYYGAFVPQRVINRAGEPTHPDLYWSDVPVAMKSLGLRYRRYSNKSNGDNMSAFLDWIEAQLDAGRPVIAGVKIHPTEHPEWGLDHMVLVVGHDRGQALYINTTWGYRKRFTRAELATSAHGIAFHNGRGRYFAYAILGPRGLRPQVRVGAIDIDSEDDDELRGSVVAAGLEVGRSYRLSEFWTAKGKPKATRAFTAESAEQRLPVVVNKKRAAIFRYQIDASR